MRGQDKYSQSRCNSLSHQKLDLHRLGKFKEIDRSSAIYIDFVSETPINLTLVEQQNADLNDDGIVNILDITVVAAAYGSKLGDPKWNSVADLDNNEVINIVDITLDRSIA